MQFSRSHAGMLAIVSIFTGVIAPVGSYLGVGTPLPLTDKQWIAYVMLLLLIVVFYLVSIGSWKKMRIFSYILLGLIISVFYLTLTDSLENIRTGYILTELSWGWIFLVAGGALLLGTMIFDYDEYTAISSLSDKIVGLIGSITLAILSVIIVSISFSWHNGHDDKLILSGLFGSGNIETHTGVTLSPAYEKIEDLEFDRKTDSLSFRGVSKDANLQRDKTFYIGNKKIVIKEDKIVSIDGITQSGKVIAQFLDDQSLIVAGESRVLLITPGEERTFSGSSELLEHITKDSGSKTLAWSEKTPSGYKIYKNSENIGEELKGVDSIALSPSGYDIMVKGLSLSGEVEIIKNGTVLEKIRDEYIRGTYKTNGSHFSYVVKKDKGYRIVYDGGLIAGEFEEVREIFLEKSGNSYAYFARPIGEEKYCLFTRYRGNICDLEGYMNPRISADGGSILFAGLKDKTWSIYRNTGIVIADTGYRGENIHDDYVFFDITNPRLYLFIEKGNDGKYTFRKNGKIIPGTWKDVGLDVAFGYDNKVIMTAKDDTGWRILEF